MHKKTEKRYISFLKSDQRNKKKGKMRTGGGPLLLLGLTTLAVQTSLGSIINENMYFPRVSRSAVKEKWQGVYKNLNLRETSYTCTKFIK